MEQSMVEREISVMRVVRHPNVVELKEVMEFKKDSTRHTSTSLSVPSISATTEVSPTAIT